MFNVCDAQGQHIGFLSSRYPDDRRQAYYVALCSKPLDNSSINWNEIKRSLADLYETWSMFGKLKEDALMDKVKEEWNAVGDEVKGQWSTDQDKLRYIFFKKRPNLSPTINTSSYDIQGYICMDVTDAKFRDGMLVIDAGLEYITPKALEGRPLYAWINQYPRVYHSTMGVAEGLVLGANWSDFGGRNHTHTTVIDVRSGNLETRFHIPMQIPFKKDTSVQLYFEGSRLTNIFYDDVIYYPNTSAPPEGRPAYSFKTDE